MGDCASSEERKEEERKDADQDPKPSSVALARARRELEADDKAPFPSAPQLGTKSRAVSNANDVDVGRVARPVKDSNRKSVAELDFVDGKVPLPAPKKSILTPRPSASVLPATEPALRSEAAQPPSKRDSRVPGSSRASRVARTVAENAAAEEDSAAPVAIPSGPHRFEGLEGLAGKRKGDRVDYTLDELDLEMCEEFWEECRRKCGSLKKAFNKLDVELNARIKKREFKTVGDTEHLNCKWMQEHFAHIFWLLDTNEDGIMRYEEFNGERLKLAMPVSPGSN